MRFLSLLKLKSKSFYISICLLSLISTITNFGVLFIINTAVAGKEIPFFNKFSYLIFIVLITISFLTTVFFQGKMTHLTNDIIFNLEISIIQKLRNSSFESFEKMGKEKIYAVIGDASILGRIPETLIVFVNSAISILCAIGYLFWQSPFGSLTITLFIVILFCVYIYRNRNIMIDMNKIRDYQDLYYASLRELIDGFKQVRISLVRNNNLYEDHILNNRITSKNLTVKNSKKYIMNQLSGTYSWYILLGFIVFGLPFAFKLNPAQIAIFITTVLFIMGPVSGLVNVIPFFSRVKIAIERIDAIDALLSLNQPVSGYVNDVNLFTSIRFEDIIYEYGESTFSLELTDFSILENELLFVIGGNGSGKTTFINILTGLYKPVSGSIYLNDRKVSWDQFQAYSNNMAVIYNDQRLFQYNYDEHDFSADNKKLNFYVEMLGIQKIFKFDSDKKRLDINLSKGQQKRLALLLALLENKPIIILDEWAAEQDPYNRNSFYDKWLLEMKNLGKTVIVISHDDESFHQADRIVKFKYGKIISDVYQSQQYS